jgi:hypothetical protein
LSNHVSPIKLSVMANNFYIYDSQIYYHTLEDIQIYENREQVYSKTAEVLAKLKFSYNPKATFGLFILDNVRPLLNGLNIKELFSHLSSKKEWTPEWYGGSESLKNSRKAVIQDWVFENINLDDARSQLDSWGLLETKELTLGVILTDVIVNDGESYF